MNDLPVPLPTKIEGGPLAVKTDSLTKAFGRRTALSGLNLQVPEGAIYLLVGPNGAGKTTTLEILLNLTQADGGTARAFSKITSQNGVEVRARSGYVPERHDRCYPWMTVERLVEHHAALFPSWDAEYARHLASTFELSLDQPYGSLSKGEARRVQITLALARRPDLLLLDEPTDGLDPVARDRALRVLAEHVTDVPTTALISTHRIYELERLADHMGIIRDGRLLAQARRSELHGKLRRYHLTVPDDWNGSDALKEAVLERAGSGRV